MKRIANLAKKLLCWALEVSSVTTDAKSLHGKKLTTAICLAIPALVLTLLMCAFVALFQIVEFFFHTSAAGVKPV